MDWEYRNCWHMCKELAHLGECALCVKVESLPQQPGFESSLGPLLYVIPSSPPFLSLSIIAIIIKAKIPEKTFKNK